MATQIAPHDPSRRVAQLLLRSLGGLLSVLLIASSVAAICPTDVLTGRVGFLFMAATPPQIVLAMIWRCGFPRSIATLRQPAKGLALLGLNLLFTIPAAALLIAFSGNGMGPPTPFLIVLTMLPIIVMLWVVPALHCWPVSALTRHPLALGLGTLAFCYLVSFALFTFLLSFAFLEHAPVYDAALDPHGLFDTWAALAVMVTMVAMVLALMLLDFWPIAAILPEAGQPLFGIVAMGFVTLASVLIFFVFTHLLGWAPIQVLVRFAVATIFGIFIVDTMTGHELWRHWPQPRLGLVKLGLSLLFGALGYRLYATASSWFAGAPISNTAPDFALDLWIANAMLGITFPTMIVVAEFFGFWPFTLRGARER